MHILQNSSKSNRNIKTTETKLTPLTHIHDRSLPWLDTDTSIKSSRVKLVLWPLTSTVNEMVQSCKCFPHVSKMPTLIHVYNLEISIVALYMGSQFINFKHNIFILCNAVVMYISFIREL